MSIEKLWAKMIRPQFSLTKNIVPKKIPIVNDDPADNLDERIAPHLEYFADRSNLLFAYHFCVLEFRGDEDFHGDPSESDRVWMIKTIQTACLHTSLIALRDLEDFFTPRTKNSKPDDLKASDFGMEIPLRFLTADERNWINKLIAHTTQHGASRVGHRWDILELISKAVAQCDAFLDWIKKNYSLEHFYTWTAAAATQAKTKAILKAIQDESKRQQKEAQQDAP